MRWFYKTTEGIPVNGVMREHFGGKVYRVLYVQGGFDSTTGNVYINYNYEPTYNLFFWEMHIHEFLHRLFWIFKWEKMHKVMDFINLVVYKQSVIKRIRLGKK